MRFSRALFGALAVLALVLGLMRFGGGTALAVTASPIPSPTPDCGTALYTPTPGSPIISAPMASQLKHSELCSVLSVPGPQLQGYGAACDSVTDDKNIVNAVPQFPVFLSFSNCLISESLSNLPLGRWVGNNATLITTESGVQHLRAPDTTAIPTPPAYTGSRASIVTAFDGDFTKVHLAFETNIIGACTLGCPVSGYQYNPNEAGIYGMYRSTSGFQTFPYAGPGAGRTNGAAMLLDVKQNGSGDLIAYSCGGLGDGPTFAGGFPGEPAIGCFEGDINGAIDGQYLNPYEVHCEDNGHDDSCVGMVNNFARTNNTGANGQIWEGYMVQSLGTQPVDGGYTLRGLATIGVDLAAQNWEGPITGAAAIAIGAGNCIYPDATNTDASHFSRYTALGNTSWCYNTSDSAIEETVGGDAVDEVCDLGIVMLKSSGSTSNYVEFIDGSGTPDKFIVASGGALTVLNNSSANVWQVSDAGTTAQAGQAKAAALSNSTTTEGVLPPLYTAAGASVTATFHGSTFSCTFSASTTCDLGASYWTGAAVFATAPQGCMIGNQGGSGINFTVFATGSATAKFFASASNSATITGFCFGA